MSSIRRILERREAIRSEMMTMHAAHADGAMPSEIQTQFDAKAAELRALDATEARAVLMDELALRSAGQTLGSDASSSELLDGYSLRKAIAMSAGLIPVSGREAEVNQELQRRDGAGRFRVPMSALEQRAVVAAGSPLISTTVGPVIDRLRNASIVSRAGATYLPGLVGNASFPALTASANATWLADGVALTESDPTLAQVLLSPKTVGGLTEYSRQTLLQASPAVDDMIRLDLSAQIAAAIDLAAISGSGTAPVPKGILSTSGIGNVALGTNGAALAYANVCDLVAQVANANGDDGNVAFLSNTKVRTAIRKLVDTQGRPLTEAVVLSGTPAFYSNAVTSAGTKGTGTALSTMLYGRWSELLIGVWSSLEIVSNPYGVAFERGGVVVRAFATVDVAVRHAASFAAITDIIA